MTPFVLIALSAPVSWEPQKKEVLSCAHETQEPFWMPARKLCQQPVYVCLVLGYSACECATGSDSGR